MVHYLGIDVDKTPLASWIPERNKIVPESSNAPHIETRAFPLSVKAQSWRHQPTAPTTNST